jgi:hypothetical protein
VPEIFALPEIADRVVLNIIDALVSQYEGEQIPRLHTSVALNELRFSKDPVALDVLTAGDIAQQRRRESLGAAPRTNRFEIYFNAALLELGVADLRRVRVMAVDDSREQARPETPPPSPPPAE